MQYHKISDTALNSQPVNFITYFTYQSFWGVLLVIYHIILDSPPLCFM